MNIYKNWSNACDYVKLFYFLKNIAFYAKSYIISLYYIKC